MPEQKYAYQTGIEVDEQMNIILTLPTGPITAERVVIPPELLSKINEQVQAKMQSQGDTQRAVLARGASLADIKKAREGKIH